eukprot:9474422-Pyramimonas_sp.AAC.2
MVAWGVRKLSWRNLNETRSQPLDAKPRRYFVTRGWGSDGDGGSHRMSLGRGCMGRRYRQGTLSRDRRRTAEDEDPQP